MKCPVCKTEDLSLSSLESNLTSRHCDKCGGNWIQSFEYWKWREQHREKVGEPEQTPVPTAPNPPATGALVAKYCPECRSILVRYKVGHGVSFALDQCGNCGGVWFDRDEWEALKARGLHDDVYTIFTSPWQSCVRKEESVRNQEQIYVKKFGEEGLDEIKRMKEWIDNHPRRHEILAFLMYG
ncbi:MAG TPA: zf-TFIIB domain-containing protein [Blastocatellia bacterium]|nr:zf-TFIIB domain-containing protein [Blastocatellia bacterium]